MSEIRIYIDAEKVYTNEDYQPNGSPEYPYPSLDSAYIKHFADIDKFYIKRNNNE